MNNKLRPKVFCEICGMTKKAILHRHHIIPCCDDRCSNNDSNLAILCPNCHSMVHSGELIIVGVYDSTDGPTLMWFNKKEEAPLPKDFWKVKENPLVKTLSGDEDDLPEEYKEQ